MSKINTPQIEEAIRLLLEAVGEDPNREGLLDTPKRVAKMYEEVFSGLTIDPKEYFETIFHEDHEELVLVKDIPLLHVRASLSPFLREGACCLYPERRKSGWVK